MSNVLHRNNFADRKKEENRQADRQIKIKRNYFFFHTQTKQTLRLMKVTTPSQNYVPILTGDSVFT